MMSSGHNLAGTLGNSQPFVAACIRPVQDQAIIIQHGWGREPCSPTSTWRVIGNRWFQIRESHFPPGVWRMLFAHGLVGHSAHARMGSTYWSQWALFLKQPGDQVQVSARLLPVYVEGPMLNFPYHRSRKTTKQTSKRTRKKKKKTNLLRFLMQ